MDKIVESITLKKCMSADRGKVELLESELLYIKDKKLLYLGDGVTPGGIPITEHNFSNEAYEKLSYIILDKEINLNNIKTKTSEIINTFFELSKAFNMIKDSGGFNSSSSELINPDDIDNYTNEELIRKLVVNQNDISNKLDHIINVLSTIK